MSIFKSERLFIGFVSRFEAERFVSINRTPDSFLPVFDSHFNFFM